MTNEAEAIGDDCKRCNICGFVIDTRYAAEKPTIDFTMSGRTKRGDAELELVRAARDSISAEAKRMEAVLAASVRQRDDLLVANNAYLERARKAEARVVQLEAKRAVERESRDLLAAHTADGQYCAGAKFGWNCAMEGDTEAMQRMIEARQQSRGEWSEQLTIARAVIADSEKAQ